MGRLALSAGAALVVALAVVALLPASLLYPEYCLGYPTANGVPIQPGEFCIRYDPALGRYETPPENVPADVARFATDTAHPNNFRIAYGISIFFMLLVGMWGLMSFARRRAQERGSQSRLTSVRPSDIRER